MINKILLGSMPDVDRPEIRQQSFNQGNIYVFAIESEETYTLIIHQLDAKKKEYQQFHLVVDHWVSARQLNENYLIINSWNKIYIFDIQKQKFQELEESIINEEDDNKYPEYPEYRGTQIFKLNENKLIVTELAKYPLIEEYIFDQSVKKFEFRKQGQFKSITITGQSQEVYSFVLPLNQNTNSSQTLRRAQNIQTCLTVGLKNRAIKIQQTVRQKQILLSEMDEYINMQFNDQIILLSNYLYYDIRVLQFNSKKIMRKFKKTYPLNPISIAFKHYMIERQTQRRETKIYNIITGKVITRAENIIQIDDDVIIEREGYKLIVSKLVIENIKFKDFQA